MSFGMQGVITDEKSKILYKTVLVTIYKQTNKVIEDSDVNNLGKT